MQNEVFPKLGIQFEDGENPNGEKIDMGARVGGFVMWMNMLFSLMLFDYKLI